MAEKGQPAQEPLIPKHGGYRHLKSFQIAQLVYERLAGRIRLE